MILVPCLFTVKTILMIAFILKFETMAGKFQSNLCHRRSEPFFRFFPSYFLPNLISWSILCERHFRVVNFGHDPGEQHCVHLHQPGGGDHLQDGQQPEPGAHDQSFVLVFCFGEECIIPARVGIVSLY